MESCLNSVWLYKKRWDLFSTQALFSHFLNLKKNIFPFFLTIAKNLSPVSYKGVSYETILSVGSYLKWVKIVNLQASQSSDNLSHFRHTQIQYLIIDWFGLSSCCFGFFRQTIQLIFLCCEFEILASITYSKYLTKNRVLKVSLICDSPIFILGLYRMSKNTLHINRMNENMSIIM